MTETFLLFLYFTFLFTIEISVLSFFYRTFFLFHLSLSGSQVGWSLSGLLQGKKWSTPGTDQHRDTHIPSYGQFLSYSLNLTPLTACLWTVGGNQTTHSNMVESHRARWWSRTQDLVAVRP